MKDPPPWGLGCAAFGVLGPDTSGDAVLALVGEAVRSGVSLFDTSPLYGGGRSEELLGRALDGAEPPPLLCTKVGYEPGTPYGGRLTPALRRRNYGPEFVRASVEASLKRLRRRSLDLVLIHDPPRTTRLQLPRRPTSRLPT